MNVCYDSSLRCKMKEESSSSDKRFDVSRMRWYVRHNARDLIALSTTPFDERQHAVCGIVVYPSVLSKANVHPESFEFEFHFEKLGLCEKCLSFGVEI